MSPEVSIPGESVKRFTKYASVSSKGKVAMKDTEFEDEKIAIIPKTMHRASLEQEGHVPNMQGLCDGLKD